MRSDRLPFRLLAALAVLVPGFALAAPLVGPSVGNADALQAEANRLFNRKQYAKAAELFLQATRADPGHLPAYLSLARAQFQAKRLAEACNAYRAYLRAAPEGSDRAKAQSELTLCERQLAAKKGAKDATRDFVDLKAAFYAALEQKQILGDEGAGQALRTLVDRGYVSTDLADLASRLHTEAVRSANEIHAQALAHQPISAQRLMDGRDLFDLAADVGAEPEGRRAKAAFLAGRADLEVAFAKRTAAQAVTSKKQAMLAEATAAALRAIDHFTEATLADPTQAEYKFFRALAHYRRGDREGALASLRRDLPDDPRTIVLGAVQAIAASNESGAAELERVLFSSRFPERK
ncbi:MAG TPA: tetratricopeptide repeat protein [Vulgatibacter sp.]|nr:tetratricopeptide repeat protein [Vulgatibacter sp.]